MAAILTRPPDVGARPSTPPPHLTLNTSAHDTPAAVPNKHIPVCSPGVAPQHGLLSPPTTPPSKSETIESSSLLYPPDPNSTICDDPPVYGLNAAALATAVEHVSSTPLPDPKQVFPWLHGLHADNQIQLSFFLGRRRGLRRVPSCIRGLTIVKAGGNLSFSKLKGAISPVELLSPIEESIDDPCFLDVDPKVGFSVRNFQIQACKMATVSDIVVYGDDATPRAEVEKLGKVISQAQKAWAERVDSASQEPEKFNTFVVTDSFATLEKVHPDLVALDSNGDMSGAVVDFFQLERKEMCTLSKSSEITNNVWLGPSPDANATGSDIVSSGDLHYDIHVEATDFARMPEKHDLDSIEKFLNENTGPAVAQIEFPASGTMASHSGIEPEIDGLLAFCRWLHKMANPQPHDADGDTEMDAESRPRRILIHCADGYTETSLLGIAYFMYAEGLPVHQAWVQLHRDKKRNFFAYPADKLFLDSIQSRILQDSPKFQGDCNEIHQPVWMERMDGSVPSRVLPYLYLGNLNHASNPGLLKQLGITRVLSVGEPIRWVDEDPAQWGLENFLFIDRVQDNGVDGLTNDFDKCLDFIEQGKLAGGATLVHCRVGVSRSATICIAEVMKEMGLTFPRAYCFVRARRLNVIIQPHLRFTYELLKWEEAQLVKRGLPLRRELDWAVVAREIAMLNKPYCRQ